MRGSQPAKRMRQGARAFRRQWYLMIAFCLSASSARVAGGYGYASPTVGSPIGPGTVPPSSYEGGLANTPNPMSDSGNLLITGNVPAGKHFRGYIPYDSTTSFGAALGSTRLDSFLRYSAAPQELGEYSRDYGIFYSPTGTVATMQPGYAGIFAPTSPRVAGSLMQFRAEQPANVMPITEVPPPHLPGGERDTVPDSSTGTWKWQSYAPMSGAPDEWRQTTSGELGDRPVDRCFAQQGNQPVTPEEYQRQLDQWRRDIDGARLDVPGSGQPPVEKPPQQSIDGRLGQQLMEPQRQRLLEQPPRDTDPRQRPVEETPAEGSQTDASADSQLRLYERVAESEQSLSRPPIPLDRIDAIFTPRVQGQALDNDDAGTLPPLRRMEETVGTFDARTKSPEQAFGDLPTGDVSSSGKASSLTDRLLAASGSTIVSPPPGPPERPSGDHVRQKDEVPASFAQEQFDRYTQAAESHVRQGRYYRAADSFTLASLYRPQDARTHLRRSHALLAAGEYIGSATALARAVELDSRQVLRKTDLIEAVGGPDPFVRRVIDLEESTQRSGEPHMQFLLAYIYYQMDRPQEARAAVEAAKKGLPAAPSVDLLKAAIGG